MSQNSKELYKHRPVQKLNLHKKGSCTESMYKKMKFKAQAPVQKLNLYKNKALYKGLSTRNEVQGLGTCTKT